MLGNRWRTPFCWRPLPPCVTQGCHGHCAFGSRFDSVWVSRRLACKETSLTNSGQASGGSSTVHRRVIPRFEEPHLARNLFQTKDDGAAPSAGMNKTVFKEPARLANQVLLLQ